MLSYLASLSNHGTPVVARIMAAITASSEAPTMKNASDAAHPRNHSIAKRWGPRTGAPRGVAPGGGGARGKGVWGFIPSSLHSTASVHDGQNWQGHAGMRGHVYLCRASHLRRGLPSQSQVSHPRLADRLGAPSHAERSRRRRARLAVGPHGRDRRYVPVDGLQD